MTQHDIQELERKAKEGDSSAQYNFGRLLVINNYYDDGKDFITKSAEQNNESAITWIEIHQKLTKALESVDVSESREGKKLKIWNIKKGETEESF